MPTPDGVEDFAERITQMISQSTTRPYTGLIVLGGYDSSGQGMIFCARFDGDPEVSEKRTSRGEIHLTPSNVSIPEAVKANILQDTDGNIGEYLSRLSVWVAHHDESQSCGEKTDIVVAEKSGT